MSTTLLNATITSAGTFFGPPFAPLDPKLRFLPQHANVELLFVYGSGGTSVDVYLQTTHDGSSWRDTIRFAQLNTASKRAIWRASAGDSVLDSDQQFIAPPSSWWRAKYVVAGNYTGTTMTINAIDGISLVQAGITLF